MVVEDEIGGSGKHGVESFFHLSPEWSVAQEGERVVALRQDAVPYDLTLDFEPSLPAELDMRRGESGKVISGWHVPAYGTAQPCWTLTFKQKGKLPITNRYRIRER